LNSMAVLKAQSGQTGGGRGSARMRVALSTAQMAVSMVLLVLAGLFTASLANIYRSDSGMKTDGVIMFTIAPQRNGYPAERSIALFDRLTQELGALPGVTSVTSSTTVLMSDDNRRTSARVERTDRGLDNDDSYYDEIDTAYFRTLGVPVVAGREFNATDTTGSPKVAIVNESFAKHFGMERDAVGKRMSRGSQILDIQIVGVVADAKYSSMTDAARPMFFTSHRQGERRPGFRTFYVRTAAADSGVMSAIRHVVARLDSNLPIERLQTMNDAVRGGIRQQRLMGILVGAFATLATLVAGVGLYGVVAYGVAQRTPEIGLRMALGATRATVRWMVLRQVGIIAAAGAGVGLGLALLVGRAARSLLFGLEFHDVPVLAAALAALMLVATAAGLVPASRAARIEPMRALRE